jgi:UDP-N-acetylglucosamine pyrophosphorylase
MKYIEYDKDEKSRVKRFKTTQTEIYLTNILIKSFQFKFVIKNKYLNAL